MPIVFSIDLLEKNCANVDPDLRVMILRDFCDQIRKGDITSFSPRDESRVVSIITERFTGYERVKDVQSEAVRTLDLLYPIISLNGLQQIVNGLVEASQTRANDYIKQQRVDAENVPLLRENSCQALRMVLKRFASDAHGEQGAIFFRSVVEPFIKAIAKQTEEPAKRDYYEVIQPILSSMGVCATPQLCGLLYAQLRSDWNCKTTHLFNQLSAVNAALFPLLPEDQFQVAIENLLRDLNTRGESFRRNLNVFIAVIRSSSARVGDKVPQLFSILNAELKRLESENVGDDDASTENDDARSSILDSLRVLVRDCPKEAQPFLTNVTSVGIELLSWDPNFCGEDDLVAKDDNDDATAESYNNYDDDGSYDDMYDATDYAYDDADDQNVDDVSWKVRLSASALLATVLRNKSSRSEAEVALARLLESSAPLLAKRLNDRVETVKLENLELLVAALELVSVERAVSFSVGQGFYQTNIGIAYGRDTNQQLDPLPTAAAFDATSDVFVHILTTTMADKSEKVSLKATDALRKFVLVRDVKLLPAVPTIAARIRTLISDNSTCRSNITILPTLFRLLRLLLIQCVRVDVAPPCPEALSALFALAKNVIECCTSKTPTVARASIDLCSEFAVVCCSFPDYRSLINDVYSAIIAILSSGDNEIKVAAVGAFAKVVAAAEPFLIATHANLDIGFAALGDLLSLDTARSATTTAIKAIARVAIPAEYVAAYANTLSNCLYRADRQEREASIGCLAALIASHPNAVPSPTVMSLVQALSQPIASSTTFVERELTISALSFQLVAALAKCCRDDIVGAVVERVVPRMLDFIALPTVQGLPVLEAGRAFYVIGTSSSTAHATVSANAQQLLAKTSVSEGLRGNLPVAVGALTAAEQNPSKRLKALDSLAAKINESAGGSCAAAAVGEAGRFTDLAASTTVMNVLLAPSFPSEDTSSAVINALSKGTSTLVGTQTFERLLVASTNGHNFVASRALRTSIAEGALSCNKHCLSDPNVFSATLSTLAKASTVSDATDIHEAVGQLSFWNRTAVLAQINDFLDSGNEALIGAAGLSLRHTLISVRAGGTAAEREATLATCVKFFSNVSRPDKLIIRRNGVALLQALLSEGFYTNAIHAAAFRAVAAEMAVDTALVRVTDLGVVKHRDDRGVDLRRSAFDFIRDFLAAPESATLLTTADYEEIAKGTVRALAPVAGTLASEEDEDISSTARKQMFTLRRRSEAWAYITANMSEVATFMTNSLRMKTSKDGAVDKKDEDNVVLAISLLVFIKNNTVPNVHLPLAEKIKEGEAHPLAVRARVMLPELIVA